MKQVKICDGGWHSYRDEITYGIPVAELRISCLCHLIKTDAVIQNVFSSTVSYISLLLFRVLCSNTAHTHTYLSCNFQSLSDTSLIKS